jgi:hypothetical protein
VGWGRSTSRFHWGPGTQSERLGSVARGWLPTARTSEAIRRGLMPRLSCQIRRAQLDALRGGEVTKAAEEQPQSPGCRGARAKRTPPRHSAGTFSNGQPGRQRGPPPNGLSRMGLPWQSARTTRPPSEGGRVRQPACAVETVHCGSDDYYARQGSTSGRSTTSISIIGSG